MTRAWWRDMLVRVFRQALQVAPPMLVAVSPAGGVDVVAALVGVAGAVAVSLAWGVVREVAAVEASGGGSRALAAAAGVLLGVLPVDVAGFADVRWWPVCWAALVAALIAGVHFRVDGPGVVVTRRTVA